MISSYAPDRLCVVSDFFSSLASDTSADGADTFNVRFGSAWNTFIFHACVVGNQAVHQAVCDHGNTDGNVIFDGGSDMYDIGNVIVSSLMQHPVAQQTSIWPNIGSMPVQPAADCYFGSIMYEMDFAPVATT